MDTTEIINVCAMLQISEENKNDITFLMEE
jgi:hypothetical protein